MRVDLPAGGGYLRQRYCRCREWAFVCRGRGSLSFDRVDDRRPALRQRKELATSPPTKFGAYNPDLLPLVMN